MYAYMVYAKECECGMPVGEEAGREDQFELFVGLGKGGGGGQI